jgi:hypothetical protein
MIWLIILQMKVKETDIYKMYVVKCKREMIFEEKQKKSKFIEFVRLIKWLQRVWFV